MSKPSYRGLRAGDLVKPSDKALDPINGIPWAFPHGKDTRGVVQARHGKDPADRIRVRIEGLRRSASFNDQWWEKVPAKVTTS